MLYRLLILLTKLGINALALLVVTSLFKGIRLDNNQTLIVTSVVLALVNTYLRPFVVILTLPINILTLGLFTVVINAAMLEVVSLADSVVPHRYVLDRDGRCAGDQHHQPPAELVSPPDNFQVKVFRG